MCLNSFSKHMWNTTNPSMQHNYKEKINQKNINQNNMFSGKLKETIFSLAVTDTDKHLKKNHFPWIDCNTSFFSSSMAPYTSRLLHV